MKIPLNKLRTPEFRTCSDYFQNRGKATEQFPAHDEGIASLPFEIAQGRPAVATQKLGGDQTSEVSETSEVCPLRMARCAMGDSQ